MARALENLSMFYVGDPSASQPSGVFLTYSVVDGGLRKNNCLHEVESPDFSKSPDEIWTAAVSQIKVNEEIN